ncbi:hypothetical protein GCM10029976_068690 [Kribbella albertanoniae]
MTSRSYAEYEAMFDLTELPASVLDCSAGGSSFTAEAAARGVDVVAVDPAYELTMPELVDTVRRSLPVGNDIVEEHEDKFVWHWYGAPERRDEMRLEAADRFLQDIGEAPDRYVAGCRNCRSRTGGSSWRCVHTCSSPGPTRSTGTGIWPRCAS